MSEVEFYRDHIAGLRSQLLLRDSKIEKLEAAVTRGIKLRVALEQVDRDVSWLLSWLKADDQTRPYLAAIAANVSAVLRGEP
jgi:hypothetical protein